MTHERSEHSRESAWFLYDHLGELARLNLLWLMTSVWILPLPAATTALAESIDRVADGRPCKPRDFFRATRRFARSATLLGTINAIVCLGLQVEMSFYAQRMEDLGWWSAVAWAVGAWLMVLHVSLVTIEVIVMARSGTGVRETIYQSWRIVRSAPGWVLQGTVAAACVACVFILSGIGGVLAGASAPAALLVLRMRRRDGQGNVLPGGSSGRGIRAAFRPWE